MLSQERERTFHEVVETGIQPHLAGLSLSNIKQYPERLGVDRSRTAIYNWIQKADLRPADGASPNRVAVDETTIQTASGRFWPYAAVDPRTNKFHYVDVFPFKNQQFTLVLLRDLRENTTLTLRSSPLVLADISQLRSHKRRSDSKSLVMESECPRTCRSRGRTTKISVFKYI